MNETITKEQERIKALERKRKLCIELARDNVRTIKDWLDLAFNNIKEKEYFSAMTYIDGTYQFYGEIVGLRLAMCPGDPEIGKMLVQMYKEISKARTELVRALGI